MVVDELNKSLFGRELLAIITPKTISGIKLFGNSQDPEAFEIQHLVNLTAKNPHLPLREDMQYHPASSSDTASSSNAAGSVTAPHSDPVSGASTPTSHTPYPTSNQTIPSNRGPGRPKKKEMTTSFCARLLVLDTEERLEQFSRGLLSFASQEHMDRAEKNFTLQETTMLHDPPISRKSARLALQRS